MPGEGRSLGGVGIGFETVSWIVCTRGAISRKWSIGLPTRMGEMTSLTVAKMADVRYGGSCPASSFPTIGEQVPQTTALPSTSMPIKTGLVSWKEVTVSGSTEPIPATANTDVILFDSDMDKRKRSYSQSFMVGCGLIVLLILLGLPLAFFELISKDRQTARYPGSTPISNHSNYKGLPFEFRWDDSYHTSDNFVDVYSWYSITFDLGSESRALEKCILLEGTDSAFVTRRSFSVLLCNTPSGQMIYVTRTTSLKARLSILSSAKDMSFLSKRRP